MKFATLHDVAQVAGVSYATVDRVVNARGSVAQKSVLRVREAIEKLGYERDVNAANLARSRVYRFHFLLPDDSNDFFRVLNHALSAQKQLPNMFRVGITTARIPAFSEQALVDELDGVSLDSVDCVCVVALDTPLVVDAIARARARGVKVLTLVSDISKDARDTYIGIDNFVAGKTAGRMMGLAHGRDSGVVLPIIGAHGAQDHIERLAGLRDVLAAHFPKVRLLDPVESGDAAATLHQVLTVAWRTSPQLTGVYNMGAGNEGLIDWVEAISANNRPVVVLHELLPASRSALEAGLIDAVIDQKPHQIIDQAVRIMRQLVDEPNARPAVPIITPAIYLRENLPPLPSSTDRKSKQ